MTVKPGGVVWRKVAAVLWLGAQFTVVGYLFWLSEVKGVRDHHLGLLLVPTFGVLLFPGVQVVFGGLAGLFWLAEALGAPIVIQSSWIGLVLSLAVWVSSAWLTYRFWVWALPRMWDAFGSMVNERPADEPPRNASGTLPGGAA